MCVLTLTAALVPAVTVHAAGASALVGAVGNLAKVLQVEPPATVLGLFKMTERIQALPVDDPEDLELLQKVPIMYDFMVSQSVKRLVDKIGTAGATGIIAAEVDVAWNAAAHSSIMVDAMSRLAFRYGPETKKAGLFPFPDRNGDIALRQLKNPRLVDAASSLPRNRHELAGILQESFVLFGTPVPSDRELAGLTIEGLSLWALMIRLAQGAGDESSQRAANYIFGMMREGDIDMDFTQAVFEAMSFRLAAWNGMNDGLSSAESHAIGSLLDRAERTTSIRR